MRFIFLLLLLSTTLAGCGQKGALYLESDRPATSGSEATEENPATDEEDDETNS